MKILMKLLFVLILCLAPAFASKFTIMTEDLRPYNYMLEGELTGMNTKIVQTILKNLGYEENISLYPWARALHLLEMKENGVLFSMSYTKQRAQKYKFACPLAPVEVYFFINKKSDLVLNSLEDIKGLKVGVVQDFGAHQKLVQLGFENLDYSSSTLVMVQKLLENKIDTFAATVAAIHALNDKRIDLSQVLQTSLLLYKTDLCIAFNPAISDAEVQKWQDELIKFFGSKEYEELYNQYIKGGGE